MNLRIQWATFFVFLGLVVGDGARGQSPESEEDAHAASLRERTFPLWMDVKLKESQAIFAALARADYPAIRESAETLRLVNRLEDFVRRRTPGYRTHLRAFEFAVDEIQRQAREENLQGVTLGFHQLTLSCVHCHNELRRTAQRPQAPPEPGN